MSKVSIIIPVYNAEAFLHRCLDSILTQTHEDWEAICIDDGSKDSGGRILDAYASRDCRIRVVHQANAGVSSARNAALKLIGGKYVTFVDSDDFLHPQALEISVGIAERDGSDLVAYTYDRRYRTGLVIRHALSLPEPGEPRFVHFDPARVESFTTEDIFNCISEYSKASVEGCDKRWTVKHCQPWRCLYRTEAVKDIAFIKGIIYEDFPWWGAVLLNVRKASIINLPLYFYYPNRKSYILSSDQSYKIESLKVAIAAAEKVLSEGGDARQRELWDRHFVQPFKRKLEKKLRRAKRV